LLRVLKQNKQRWLSACPEFILSAAEGRSRREVETTWHSIGHFDKLNDLAYDFIISAGSDSCEFRDKTGDSAKVTQLRLASPGSG